MSSEPEVPEPKAEIAAVEIENIPDYASIKPAGEEPPKSSINTPVIEPLSSNDIFRSIFRNQAQNPQVPPQAPPPTPQNLSGESFDQDIKSRPFESRHDGTDQESLRRSQEEEFQRRLRGEYEASHARLTDVVTSNLSRPLRLTAIRLNPPPPTTRTQFLYSLISPFLTSPNPNLPHWLNPAPSRLETLQDVLSTTRSLMSHLDKFGIFDIERSGVKLQAVRGGDDDEVELILGLRERGRLFLKAGTEVGGGEGGGNITARIRNAFGGAETVEVNASLGTKTKSAYQASISTPILASPLLSFALQAFSFDRDNTAFASHRETAQGGRAKFTALAPWGSHDLSYEFVKRDIGHLAPTASVSIRELAHPTTKSALIHTWTSDTRDDPWTGSNGSLLKLTNEYAGLPGSSKFAHFFRTIFTSHLSRSLYEGSNIHYSISSFTSSLLPLFPSSSADASGHPATTPLPDRVYLGGPNSMRGWKINGIGLRDGQDSLGGDLAWATGLSVFAPIPKKEHWPLKIHSFLNVGKVVSYDRGLGLVGNVEKMYRNPNVSVGLGLMYRLDPIRVELNFSMPLVGRKGDRLSRGFGLGVGIEFL